MCSIFGLIDYGNTFEAQQRETILNVLAREAEIRGTDATGFAYNNGDYLSIYKRPKPAHKVKLKLPENANIIMGHTRMTTQGNAFLNWNNHPFYGKTGNVKFALAHNGIIFNDDELRNVCSLPSSKIQTDSYVIVQMVEKEGMLSFKSLKEVSEKLRGNFTYTILDEYNNLWFVKGDNPLTLYHSERYKFYIYASTDAILDKAIGQLWSNKSREKLDFKQVDINCGDILKVKANGSKALDYFEFHPYTFKSTKSIMSQEFEFADEKELKQYADMFGMDEIDIDTLLEYGFSVPEIKEMLCNPYKLNEMLDMVYCDYYFDEEYSKRGMR